MNRLPTLILMLAIAASGSAVASEIYKWVDEDGNVHYGDRPVGEGVDIERMPIQSRPTNPDTIQANVDARRAYEESVRNDALERESEKEQAAEAQAELEQRQQLCNTYRERLQKSVQSRRLYRLDEAGEREYLDEDQVIAAREDLQSKVQEYCSN